ncbi:hypothetical protein [Zhaonella formicivorans]|nr:hypothetical protein [Zhaonella formicivorans]
MPDWKNIFAAPAVKLLKNEAVPGTKFNEAALHVGGLLCFL